MRLVAFAVAGFVGLASMASTSKADIEIAVVGPMSGEYEAYGQQMRRGAEQAVSDINTGGGLLGDELELFVKDDACDPVRAVIIANQLPGDRVKFVAGHLCSAASINAARIYAEEGLVQITPASTDPTLTEQGSDNVFRLSGREDQQGILAGNLLARYFTDRNIAVLHNDSAHGRRLADTVRTTLHAAGVSEALYEVYQPAGNDYSDLVGRMKELSIGAIYIGGHHSEAAVMIKQARAMGYAPQLVAGDTLIEEEFWQISEGAGEGAIMTAAPDPRLNPDAAAVVSRFRAQKFEPEGYTLNTYAAVQIWVQAVRQAKSTAPEDVIAAMRSTRFRTVIGEVAFDAKGDVSTPRYIWYRWSNGTFAPLQ
jgi:branched-chain amino acid transport system substrate-binding protein